MITNEASSLNHNIIIMLFLLCCMNFSLVIKCLFEDGSKLNFYSIKNSDNKMNKGNIMYFINSKISLLKSKDVLRFNNQIHEDN
jgi:hypothetical protein